MPSQREGRTPARRLPVVLVTGFLGSGKTTLLARVLSAPEASRTAVIVNELGEIALDHHLVRRVDDELFVLGSGCVCCSSRGELVDAIASLVERRASGSLDIDRIVVETSGASDPRGVVEALRSPRIGPDVTLDAIVTTLDAVHGPRTLEEDDAARAQVALADRVILTKTDIASVEQSAHARVLVSLLAPTSLFVSAVHGDADPRWVLHGGADAIVRGEASARVWLEHDAHAGHSHSHHADAVAARSIALSRPLRWGAFATWASFVTQSNPRRVLRIKGILDVEGDEAPVVFHAVLGTVHPTDTLDTWPWAPRSSRLVMLTRGMRDEELVQLEAWLRESAA